MTALTLHSLFRPHRRAWIYVADSFLYAHLAIVNLLGVYIFSNQTSQSSEKSWTTLYLIAFFAPSVYLVLYVASVLHKKWRSRRRLQPLATVTVEAASDAAYAHIEQVVEVDSRDEELESLRSYRSVAEKDHRHQELWFNDN